jgi:hypothetical protein
MTAQSGLGFSGIVAIQIPDDGAPGTVLTKLTADNYDYDWLAGGGGASTIVIEDEGVAVGVPADTLDFVGLGVTVTGAGTTKTITIPGGGSVDNMQDTYDNTGVTQPKIEVIAANGAITFRDAAISIGDLLILEDNAGVDFFNVSGTQMQFGATPQRLLDINNIIAGYGGIEFYPDDFTRTIVGGPALVWSSTITSSVPGGGGVGNETAPNCIAWAGEAIFTEQGNLFNSQSLFAQSTLITLEGANTGPIYTMINQPKFRTGAAGGSRTGSQQNAVRSQMSIGPNLAGNFSLATHEPYFATCFVDATVGTANIVTVNYFAPKAPGLVAGGTIGTLNVLDIPNIPSTGITTLRGINSAMNSGQFIFHSGVAAADFTNSAFRMRFDDNAGIEFGTGNDVLLRWDASTFNFEFAAGGDLEITGPTAGEIILSSPAAVSGLQMDFAHIGFGTADTIPAANWFVRFEGPNNRQPTSAGFYSDVWWTSGGLIDVDGLAMTEINSFRVDANVTVLNGGSVLDQSTMFLAGMGFPGSGAATRLQTLRVTGRSRMDGLMNYNEASLATLTADATITLPVTNSGRFMILQDADANGPWTIEGVVNDQPGDAFYFINDGANGYFLGHQDVGAAAADRIITPTGVDLLIGPDEMAKLWYDPVATRWRVLETTGA